LVSFLSALTDGEVVFFRVNFVEDRLLLSLGAISSKKESAAALGQAIEGLWNVMPKAAILEGVKRDLSPQEQQLVIELLENVQLVNKPPLAGVISQVSGSRFLAWLREKLAQSKP
jgi:hypothetical protein